MLSVSSETLITSAPLLFSMIFFPYKYLDRLVGFELSPVLWKKVKPSLSAGRVQSVAVRLIVEREKEIIRFKGARFYKVAALFSFIGSKGEICKLKADLNHKFGTEEEARAFLEL